MSKIKSKENRSTSNSKLLKGIAEDLRRADKNDEKLMSILEDYQHLIISSIAESDLIKESKKNLKLDGGIAISPSFAASCLVDSKRTNIFVKGIFDAIEKLKDEGKKEVHIFYAGTGPYATLLLPIMASFDPGFVQCSLLEVNEISLNCLREVIASFGFNNHVKEFILADATKYEFDANSKVDILLSETMCSGLMLEPQVPIVMNLIPQLSDPFILIPQNIKLTLAFMKDFRVYYPNAESREQDYCHRLTCLLDVNIEEVVKFSKQIDAAKSEWRFPTKEINISLNDASTFHNLVVLTEIQVFESNKISLFESDITRPVSLMEFENIKKDQKFTIRYKVDKDPGFIYQMNEV